MNWKLLKQRAYVPYSEKAVACIVKGVSGKYYPGVRVENVSFPITIPAIQSACCFCLSEGDNPEAVILDKDENIEQLSFWIDEFDLTKLIQSDLEGVEFENPKANVSSSTVKSTLVTLLDQAITIQSDFPVSSLLECDSGFISGVNVEVSEWTKGLCAERMAIAKAFSTGHTNFKSMSLHTLKGEFSSPCGACRQVIYEHLPNNQIDFHHADGTLSTHYTNDLLPLSFTSSSLKK